MKLGINDRYAKSIKRLIVFILKHPKIVALSSIILVFAISYDVIYDFTVKSFNGYLLSKYGGYNLNSFYLRERPDFYKIKEEVDVEYIEKELTKLTFEDENVLTFECLGRFHNLIKRLEQLDGMDTIISPFLNWPVHFPYETNTLTENAQIDMVNHILKVLNYDQSMQLYSLFFDDLTKVNHLVRGAGKFHMYIIHKKDTEMERYFKDLDVFEKHSTSNKRSIQEFINYYLGLNNPPFLSDVFTNGTTMLEFFFLSGFLVVIYLIMMHQHKSKYNHLLFVAWVFEVLVSAAAGVNLVTYMHKHKTWKILFEPSSVFTRIAYLLSIFLLSARNLLILIRTLGVDENPVISRSSLHKKLYKLYLGFDGVKFRGFPVPTKNLIFDLTYLLGLALLGKCVFRYYFEGPFLNYLSMRLSVLVRAIGLSLIFDNILQLTCLVGKIVIDHTKYEWTDLLGNDGSNSLTDDSTMNGFHDNKNVSSYLLRSDQTKTGHPDINSLRHKLALVILRIGYYRPSSNTEFIFPVAFLAHFFAIFLHWAIIIPHDLLNDSSNLFAFGSLTILSNHNGGVYYMELGSIMLFIIAVTLLVIKFTEIKSINGDQKVNNYSDSEFDNFTANKQFKNIELSSTTTGHYLDILKIKTNQSCSFVISIGLDRRILVWSPLNRPSIPEPANISTTMIVENTEKEFWPINHINMSDDGKYIILLNYKFGIIKCYERENLSYIWEMNIFDIYPDIKVANIKVLESFFRRKTVPGYLTRTILRREMQKNTSKRVQKRSSQSSIYSMSSLMSGNFPPPPSRVDSSSTSQKARDIEESSSQLNKVEFFMILESGDILSISCNNGEHRRVNVFDTLYSNSMDIPHKLVSAKKMITPRISDRIVLQLFNSELVMVTIVNNKLRLRILSLSDNYHSNFNRYSELSGAAIEDSFKYKVDFKAKHDERTVLSNEQKDKIPTHFEADHPFNRLILETLEFVGFVIRVIGSSAEIIDTQSGTVLKKFTVGYFKPNSFKISHSEPTHCKFCGCASISSLSVIYEDFDCNTLIIHTFKMDLQKSKNNICLRVERDPREIRCLGFDAVTEHQYWYQDIQGFQSTDVNIILGLKKKSSYDAPKDELISGIEKESSLGGLSDLIDNSGLMTLRSRKYKKAPTHTLKSQRVNDVFEGFLINVFDGKIMTYELPSGPMLDTTSVISTKIFCIEKYGYKSIITNFNNLIEIFYLGSNNLIDHDIYYTGTNAARSAILNDQYHVDSSQTSNNSQAINSELLFIKKRRRAKHGNPNISQERW